VTNASSCSELIRINDICHEHNIQFISGDTYGLFGYVFDDFGMGTEVDNEGKKLGFKVLDVDGEQPKTCYIESITKVSCHCNNMSIYLSIWIYMRTSIYINWFTHICLSYVYHDFHI